MNDDEEKSNFNNQTVRDGKEDFFYFDSMSDEFLRLFGIY